MNAPRRASSCGAATITVNAKATWSTVVRDKNTFSALPERMDIISWIMRVLSVGHAENKDSLNFGMSWQTPLTESAACRSRGRDDPEVENGPGDAMAGDVELAS